MEVPGLPQLPLLLPLLVWPSLRVSSSCQCLCNGVMESSSRRCSRVQGMPLRPLPVGPGPLVLLLVAVLVPWTTCPGGKGKRSSSTVETLLSRSMRRGAPWGPFNEYEFDDGEDDEAPPIPPPSAAVLLLDNEGVDEAVGLEVAVAGMRDELAQLLADTEYAAGDDDDDDDDSDEGLGQLPPSRALGGYTASMPSFETIVANLQAASDGMGVLGDGHSADGSGESEEDKDDS